MQPTIMDSILSLKNLRKHFESQKAVDDISLEIERGQIFGLLGPNGAGKTTLIRMITGIFYPDQGEIFFDGKKFDPQLDVAKIGYMPEERGLYKKMKVGEQALYLAQLKALTNKLPNKKLRTGLEDLEWKAGGIKKWKIFQKEWDKNFSL